MHKYCCTRKPPSRPSSRNTIACQYHLKPTISNIALGSVLKQVASIALKSHPPPYTHAECMAALQDAQKMHNSTKASTAKSGVDNCGRPDESSPGKPQAGRQAGSTYCRHWHITTSAHTSPLLASRHNTLRHKQTQRQDSHPCTITRPRPLQSRLQQCICLCQRLCPQALLTLVACVPRHATLPGAAPWGLLFHRQDLHYTTRNAHTGCMYTKNTATRKRTVIDEPVASLDMGACRAAATTSISLAWAQCSRRD